MRFSNESTEEPSVVPQPDSGDSVYMLNLLRFKNDGGEMQYYREYGAQVGPMIAKRNGGVVLNLKGIGPVIANEEIDRLILVRYPIRRRISRYDR